MNDRKEIYCTGCGHRWILIYDKEITQELYLIWAEKVWTQHQIISGNEHN